MLSEEYDIDGRNPWELEPYYSRHVIAITREELHGKSDIACELAFRDKRIADTEAELLSLREQLEALNRQEPFGYIDAVHNWNYTNLKSELNTVAFISKTADGLVRPDYAMALFTAAKPAEDK